MNKNEIIIIVVLCILLLLVILQIKKSRRNENFNVSNLIHNSETCRQGRTGATNFPFTFDECSQEEYLKAAGDIHLNYNSDFINTMRFHNLHFVYPENPCCLRTCINDFTFTKENTDPNSLNRRKIGEYKSHIDKNLYFASNCNACLDNFYIALKRLASKEHCDENIKKNKKTGTSKCEKHI